MGRKAVAIVFRNKIYASVNEAARLTNYKVGYIKKVVYGKRNKKRG